MKNQKQRNAPVIAAALLGSALSLLFTHKADAATPAKGTDAPVTNTVLRKIAFSESSYNPGSHNKKSGAAGLFQFKEARWLEVLYKHGDKLKDKTLAHGVGKRVVDKQVEYYIRDEKTRQHIMDARYDTKTAWEMARAGLTDNARQLDKKMKHPVERSAINVYMTQHFGVKGAADFLNTLNASPKKSFASITPDWVCERNPVVCYKDGNPKQPRSVEQVHTMFSVRLDTAPAKMPFTIK